MTKTEKFQLCAGWIAAAPPAETMAQYAAHIITENQPKVPFTEQEWDEYTRHVQAAATAAWMLALIEEMEDITGRETKTILSHLPAAPVIDEYDPDDTQELPPAIPCRFCDETMFYICDGCGAAYSHKHGWDDPAIPDENDPEYQHLIDDDIPTEDEIDDMYEDWGARFRDTWNYDG